MSDGKNMFRVVSFGGFHKDDVAEYIEKMQFRFKEAEEKYILDKVTLDKKVKGFEEILAKYDIADLDKYIVSSTELTQKNIELTKETDTLTLELANSKLEIENIKNENAKAYKENIIDRENEEILALKKQLEDEKAKNLALIAENNELKSKSEEITDIKETIIKLELDARIRAKKITESAKEEASSMMDEVKVKSEEVLAKAREEYSIQERSYESKLQRLEEEIATLSENAITNIESINDDIMAVFKANKAVKERLLEFITLDVEEDNYETV